MDSTQTDARSELVAWAEKVAKVHRVLARDAGMTAGRYFHEGVAVALDLAAGDKKAGSRLAGIVRATGARGARGLAGVREGLAMVEGVRTYRDTEEVANLAAWVEPEPEP